MKEYLLQIKAEFFSHDMPGEKPFKAVLRGLPDIDTNELVKELTNHYKLPPSAVFRMTRRNEKTRVYRDCLYLLHFKKGTITMSSLQAIRSLFSVIIKWEPYRGGRHNVTQCQRCLNFGHGTRNCNILPRCSNCAQKHTTSECPLAEAVAFKCANCGGAHQGSSRQCPKREEYKYIRKQVTGTNQQQRNKTKGPIFKPEDFPNLLLRNPVSTQSNIPPRQEAAPASAWNTQPRLVQHPAGLQQHHRQASTDSSELFSAGELMQIFTSMSAALRQCKTKADQIQVLGSFIIQYGS